MNTEQQPEQHRELPAEEAAHCLCPIAEAYAGMDDTADWAHTHPMVVGGAA